MAKKKKEEKKKVIVPTYKFFIQRVHIIRPRPRDFYGFFTDEQWQELKICDDCGIEIESLIPEKEFFAKYPEFCPAENTEIKVKALKKDDKIKAKTLKNDADLFNIDPINPKPVDAISDKIIETDNVEPGLLHEVMSKTVEDVIEELKNEGGEG